MKNDEDVLDKLQLGMLREQLRRANVRLIAVNEGVDTGSGFDDDFLPFRDVINEYYKRGYPVCAFRADKSGKDFIQNR